MKSHYWRWVAASVLVMSSVAAWGAQEAQAKPATPAAASKSEDKPPARPAISTNARLHAAKSAYLKRGEGNDLPFDMVSQAVEGWGRFTLVADPEKADIVIEVSAPETPGGVTMTSKTSTSPVTGRPEESTGSTRTFGSSGPVKLLVYETKTKTPLFVGSEQPKSALRQKQREDNLIEPTERLIKKFHDRLDAADQPAK